MFVTLGSQREMCMLHFVICDPLLIYYVFYMLFHNRHNFVKNVTEYKMCALSLSTTLVCNVSHSKKNSARYDQNWSSSKVPIILVRL
jgi:formate hydrogenlyase subunit 4